MASSQAAVRALICNCQRFPLEIESNVNQPQRQRQHSKRKKEGGEGDREKGRGTKESKKYRGVKETAIDGTACPELVAHPFPRPRRHRRRGVYWAFIFATHFVLRGVRWG